jgi:hypothetical protein
MTARKRGPVPSPRVSLPHGADEESAKSALDVSTEDKPAESPAVEPENQPARLGPIAWLALILWLGAFGLLALVETINLFRYLWR